MPLHRPAPHLRAGYTYMRAHAGTCPYSPSHTPWSHPGPLPRTEIDQTNLSKAAIDKVMMHTISHPLVTDDHFSYLLRTLVRNGHVPMVCPIQVVKCVHFNGQAWGAVAMIYVSRDEQLRALSVSSVSPPTFCPIRHASPVLRPRTHGAAGLPI